MSETNEPKKFIGVYFECCNAYSRIYKNKEGTHYAGRCPRCMRPLTVPIGEGGTNARLFKAR